MGRGGGQGQRGERLAAPQPVSRTSPVPANVSVPVAVARLEEAPHPLLLAGAGRVAAAAAAAAPAAAAAAAGAPCRRRHHAPAACSGGGGGGGGRAASGGIREAQKRLAAPNLPDNGACPVAAGALRARDSSSPGFARAGELRALQSPGVVTLVEREEGKGDRGVGSRGCPGDARGRDGRQCPGGPLEGCQLRVCHHNARAPDTQAEARVLRPGGAPPTAQRRGFLFRKKRNTPGLKTLSGSPGPSLQDCAGFCIHNPPPQMRPGMAGDLCLF